MPELYGQTWARALCHELRYQSYLMGTFAAAMANAAWRADSTNLAAIGQGFPELAYVVGEWRTYGSSYLVALAAGDVAAMEALRDTWQERDLADHDRQLARMEG